MMKKKNDFQMFEIFFMDSDIYEKCHQRFADIFDTSYARKLSCIDQR